MSPTSGRRAAAEMPLFAALQRPECYPHPVAATRVIETHISWVILTGEYAYKIKKPVNLGFADFTTPGLRRHYCEEEIRLNRRLAPGLYLDVVEIRGTAQSPRIGGDGPLLDHAVRMREFPQDTLASQRIAGGAFGASEIDDLAVLIADFHEAAPRARPAERWASPELVLSAALDNFEQMLPLLKANADQGTLRTLRQWTEREFAARRGIFEARGKQGFVRECHGDLHLGNIVMIGERPIPFDCIEFNDALRWIDVVSEAAFLIMDLEGRHRGDLAWRFLNRYLETTGDYAGVPLLRFYLVYRALVRAKVYLIRAVQSRRLRAERSRLMRAAYEHLGLAERFATPSRASLVVTHGPSGCGKTSLTQGLIEQIGAVRIRSDLERKRLHGLAPLATSRSGLTGGIYTLQASAAVYRRLGALAQDAVRAGYPVVVDATFLKRSEREAFRAIAERIDAPFMILDFHAPLELLRTRIEARRARAADASEADLAVLEHQLAAREPLTPAELAAAVVVDGTRPASRETWRPVIERLGQMAGGRAWVPPGRAA